MRSPKIGTTTMVSAATAKYGYVGDTTVTAGTLKLDYTPSNNGILSDSSRLVLGGGTLEYATAAGTTHNDAVRDTIFIAGASTITKSGAGAGRLRLNALSDVAASGSTVNFTAGSIADTDATNTAGILGSRARLTVGSAGTYDWAVNSTNGADGAITAYAGYSGLNLAAGTDTVNPLQDLTATTSFTGSRTTNTLKLTNTSGAAQILDVAAGNTLTLTAGGLLVTGNSTVQINNGTLKSNTATNSDLIIHQYNSGGLTIGSVIANGTGASNLTKAGTGNLTLSGTNTYTGPTFLTGGTTIISANANLGAPATGATLNLINGTLRSTADIILSNGAVGTNNRNVTLNGIGGTIETDAATTLTIGGTIQGPGGLTKTGAGTLDIRSVSYTGPTVVNAGTLKFGGAVNPLMSAYTLNSPGTLDMAGSANSIGALDGNGTVTNSGAAATFSVGALHTDTTFSGKLTNATNTLNLDKYGAGMLTLTGSTNDYTGTTTISGGTLALSGAGTLPAATNLTVSSATGIFDISALSGTSTTIGSLAGEANSSVVLGGKDLNIGGTTNATYAGVISGSGSLTKNSTSTETLTGPNTYDGVTTITKGVLAISHNTALGSTTGNTVINSNGTTTTGGQLTLSGGITIGENILVQGTGDGTPYQKAIQSTAGTNTINGTITLTGTANYRIGTTAGTLNLGLLQRSTTSGGTITFDPSVGSTVNINTALDNNGGDLIGHAGGTVVLNAANNDIGNTTVQNSTTLKVTATNALPITRNLVLGQGTLVNTSAGVGNDVGTFYLEGVNQTINALAGFANGTSNASASTNRKVTSSFSGLMTLMVGNGNGSGTFDGIIENGTGGGKLALTKTGTGTETLLGDSTFTGDTTVDGGTLEVGGANGRLSGTANVNLTGGTLLLSGSNSDRINNSAGITTSANSTTVPALTLSGNVTESVGALTVNTAGTSVFNLGTGTTIFTFTDSSAQTWNGLLQVWNWTGNPAGGGTDQLSFTSPTGLTNAQLNSITFVDPAGFSPGSYPAGLLSNGELVPVPEPTALATVWSFLGAYLWRRRRSAAQRRKA